MMCAVLSCHWSLLSLHLLPLAPPVALLPLLPPLEVRRQPAHSAQRVWPRLTRPTPAQVRSPTPTTSRRLLSSLTQSPWPRHRSSPTKGFPRTPSAMTLHSRVCFVKLADFIAITLNERLTFQFVVVVSVRQNGATCDRAVRPAEQSSQDAQIWTLLNNKKSEFLPSARQILTNTNFKPLTTEEVY